MDSVSLFLKDLIKRMLKPAKQRITIDQIFQHPWMTVKSNRPPLKIDFKQMASFSKFSKIKTIAATYIASQMTAKEIGNFQKIFKELDENHDGYLSFDELQKYLMKNKGKEHEVTIQELKALIDCIDTDKNGKINYT